MGSEDKIDAIYKLCQELKTTQEKQGVRLMRVDRAIKGDPEYNSPGIIARLDITDLHLRGQDEKIKSHDNNFQEINDIKKKAIGFIAAIGLLFGGIGSYLKDFFKIGE